MTARPPVPARVRRARRLLRRRDRERAGRFLCEGPQAVREALAAGVVEEVYATAPALERHADLAATAAVGGLVPEVLEPEVLAELTGTVTPQGLVAVCRTLGVPLSDVTARAPRLVAVLADVRDPGNAGTVVRVADAAGADAVVFAGDSVDVHNGKAVRASAGSVFHLPLVLDVDLAVAVEALHGAGSAVLAADAAGEVDLDEAAVSGLLARPVTWVFGNEAWGLPDADRALADAVVRIPIHGSAESLNLASAAAVCLYATARAQRES